MTSKKYELIQDVKLNQSRQDMSLLVVIQVVKKVAFKFTFFILLSLIVNVSFCHEDGAGELSILVLKVKPSPSSETLTFCRN